MQRRNAGVTRSESGRNRAHRRAGVGAGTLKDALNSRVRSEFRATANSMASFGFRGAFVVTGLAPAPHTRPEWAKSASAPGP